MCMLEDEHIYWMYQQKREQELHTNAIQTIGHLIILKQKVDLPIEMSILMSDWVSLMANAA